MGSEKNQETPEGSNTKESSGKKPESSEKKPESSEKKPESSDQKTEGPDQVAPEQLSTSSGLKVHGFENEIISLEKMLNRRQSKDEFKAIGLVGELGVGKSTLCRALLNKNEVKTSFLPRIWVSMSNIKSEEQNLEEAVVRRMLDCLGVDDEIIKKISEDDDRRPLEYKERLNALLYALHLQLAGKKYLIVLDDVLKKNQWYGDLSASINRSYDWHERLAYGLPKGNGGTVIVTSRDKEVAKMMVGKEENIHQLLPLWNPESCWAIFKDTVERENQKLKSMQGPEDEEKAKKDLFEKCVGLPLAAKMMGETMAEKLKTPVATMKDEAAQNSQLPVAQRSETHDDGGGTDHAVDLPKSETPDVGVSGKSPVAQESEIHKV